MNISEKNIFIFDIESNSLMGSAIAYAAIVFDIKNNKILDSSVMFAQIEAQNAGEWVKNNVIPSLEALPKCNTGLELRTSFWNFYNKWKNDCEIWGDCVFPVETNFLTAVANDDIQNREFAMPYPLKDLANFLPTEINRIEYSGLKNLTPHNPYDDCLASINCLLKLKINIIQNEQTL